MAIRTKGEDVLLGLLGLVGIIVAILYAMVKAIVTLVITHWIAVIGIVLGIILFIFILSYIANSINLQQNNKKIGQLNQLAEISRSNVKMDFENLKVNKEIITIIDNAIIHFPQNFFLDPAYLRLFEGKYFDVNNEYPEIEDVKIKYESYQYSLNRIGLILFKQNDLYIDLVPNDFLIRASDDDPIHVYLKYVEDVELIPEFLMFEKLVCSRFNFLSLTSRTYCIWKLLKERTVKYYSELWGSQYSNVFETAESSDLEDLVKAYCNILFINHLNMYNIAMFTYYLMDHDINPEDKKFREYYWSVEASIEVEFEKRKIQNFEKKLTNPISDIRETRKKYTINDTDFMNGYQFENFVALIFNHYGYKTTVTPSSGDQGIDVIAEKDGERLGIQAKCYSNAVTNSAIQEVTAGIVHHNCSKGMVVTNNNYTKSAIALAESNKIILWNRQKLTEIINEVF
jgi:HJR/Mrr/RecB family endonuclease